MSLHAKLLERQDNPLRIGLIGAGKFAAMYIAQVRRTPGVHLAGIADLSPANAKENLRRTGWPLDAYACLYKRWHLIGLEAGISVASVGLRGEPTGCPTGWRADAVAVAKRNLEAGEILDGEGGYTVVGRLMPSEASLRENCLPLGLANGWKLLEPVAAGQQLRWSTVAFDTDSTAVRLRREMEFAASKKSATQAPGLSPILGVPR